MAAQLLSTQRKEEEEEEEELKYTRAVLEFWRHLDISFKIQVEVKLKVVF